MNKLETVLEMVKGQNLSATVEDDGYIVWKNSFGKTILSMLKISLFMMKKWLGSNQAKMILLNCLGFLKTILSLILNLKPNIRGMAVISIWLNGLVIL